MAGGRGWLFGMVVVVSLAPAVAQAEALYGQSTGVGSGYDARVVGFRVDPGLVEGFDARGFWVYWDIEQRGPCSMEGRFALTGEPVFRLGRLALSVKPKGVVWGWFWGADGTEVGEFRGRVSRSQLRGYLKFTNSPRARKLVWRIPDGVLARARAALWFRACAVDDSR